MKSWKQGLWSTPGSKRRIRKVYFISVFSFLGLVLGDLDIAVAALGLPVLKADQRVFKPASVVAFGEVKPVVGSARLLPQERAQGDDFGQVNHVDEFDEVDNGLTVAEALARDGGPAGSA